MNNLRVIFFHSGQRVRPGAGDERPRLSPLRPRPGRDQNCGGGQQVSRSQKQAMADNFQPEDFADQYRDRMALARKEGLANFEQRFLRKELRLRRLIDQSALGLTAEEINIAERDTHP